MSFLGVLFCADVLVSSTSIGVCVGSIMKVGVDRSERFLRSISVAIGVGLPDMANSAAGRVSIVSEGNRVC